MELSSLSDNTWREFDLSSNIDFGVVVTNVDPRSAGDEQASGRAT